MQRKKQPKSNKRRMQYVRIYLPDSVLPWFEAEYFEWFDHYDTNSDFEDWMREIGWSVDDLGGFYKNIVRDGYVPYAEGGR